MLLQFFLSARVPVLNCCELSYNWDQALLPFGNFLWLGLFHLMLAKQRPSCCELLEVAGMFWPPRYKFLSISQTGHAIAIRQLDATYSTSFHAAFKHPKPLTVISVNIKRYTNPSILTGKRDRAVPNIRREHDNHSRFGRYSFNIFLTGKRRQPIARSIEFQPSCIRVLFN